MKHLMNFILSGKKLSIFLLSAFLLITVQCASNNSASANLPQDVLGLRLGMSKADAEKRLQELGEFQSKNRKGQNLWSITNDPHFNSIAVGFDKEDKLKFATAFSQKDRVKKQMLFTDVGDITKAKNEIMPPHHRYTWKVEATEDHPAYYVSIYGADPKYLSMYSLFGEPSREKE